MSRITTSRASFSCASSATLRACSSEVSGPSTSFPCDRHSVPRSTAVSVLAIDAELADQRLHRRRHEPREGLAARASAAYERAGDGDRLDLEERDPLGVPQ